MYKQQRRLVCPHFNPQRQSIGQKPAVYLHNSESNVASLVLTKAASMLPHRIAPPLTPQEFSMNGMANIARREGAVMHGIAHCVTQQVRMSCTCAPVVCCSSSALHLPSKGCICVTVCREQHSYGIFPCAASSDV